MSTTPEPVDVLALMRAALRPEGVDPLDVPWPGTLGTASLFAAVVQAEALTRIADALETHSEMNEPMTAEDVVTVHDAVSDGLFKADQLGYERGRAESAALRAEVECIAEEAEQSHAALMANGQPKADLDEIAAMLRRALEGGEGRG